MTFEVLEDVDAKSSISFTDSLASKGISDAAGNSLAARYLDGNIILPGK